MLGNPERQCHLPEMTPSRPLFPLLVFTPQNVPHIPHSTHTPTAFMEYFNLLCSGCPGKRGMLFSAEYLKLLISRHNASSMQNIGQELYVFLGQ